MDANANHIEHYAFVLYDKNANNMVVGVKQDGTLVFGKDYTPDSAARLFWKFVGKNYPAGCPDSK